MWDWPDLRNESVYVATQVLMEKLAVEALEVAMAAHNQKRPPSSSYDVFAKHQGPPLDLISPIKGHYFTTEMATCTRDNFFKAAGKEVGVCFASDRETWNFKGFSYVELARVGANQILCQTAGFSLLQSVGACNQQFKQISIQMSGVVTKYLL